MQTVTLRPGDSAPDFTLPCNGGTSVTLSALRPAKVVLFFYPKDNTPGCTLEAQGFSAALAAFEAAGTKLIGISRDSVASHDKFCAKHDLRLMLGSDAEGLVSEAYGTWAEKKLYGRAFMGMVRSTFLIDADGKIAQIWSPVKVKGHVEAVLAATEAL
ncbi:peroxiredoxin [Pseudogemmobacter lacusdianii]